MAKLTSDQQNRKLVIEQYRKALTIAQRNLRVEIISCKDHIFIQVGNSAVCEICAEYFGWWCPNSADHVCEYNGVKDPAHDSCIYCGCPEERK